MNSDDLSGGELPAGLHYTCDSSPGITRQATGSHFRYLDQNGKELKDSRTLERIASLAIPPAYERVWISTSPTGHLQATGFDARGRKQYRYHPAYRQAQEAHKFGHLVAFGTVLPTLRKRLDDDMSQRGMPKAKVLAVVVYLLDRSLIRIGNGEYAKQNRSYGLTTMLSRHVQITGSEICFSFPGKSKVNHKIGIHDRRIARIVQKIQELPGQELFHYLDEAGTAHSISSTDVNAYLKEATGSGFTAKEFRTWWGTLLGFADLVGRDRPASATATKRAITESVKEVAGLLGNTPSVCRKCYIHPAVLEAFASGTLPKKLKRSPEDELLSFLRKCTL